MQTSSRQKKKGFLDNHLYSQFFSPPEVNHCPRVVDILQMLCILIAVPLGFKSQMHCTENVGWVYLTHTRISCLCVKSGLDLTSCLGQKAEQLFLSFLIDGHRSYFSSFSVTNALRENIVAALCSSWEVGFQGNVHLVRGGSTSELRVTIGGRVLAVCFESRIQHVQGVCSLDLSLSFFK